MNNKAKKSSVQNTHGDLKLLLEMAMQMVQPVFEMVE